MPSRDRWPLVLPLAYFVATRLSSARAFGYNAAMAWLPAFGLLIADGLSPVDALVGFALGYLAFIAIYELGYLANDLWDAKRNPDGRHRLNREPSILWLLAFIIIRLALFATIAILTHWWRQPLWAAGFVTLAIAFGAHNLVSSRWRLTTFPVLAVLRFLLPVTALLSPAMWPSALVIAILLYMTPRWLAYAESKALIGATVRQRPRFRSTFLLALLPLVAIGSWWARSPLPLAAFVYYLGVTALAEPSG